MINTEFKLAVHQAVNNGHSESVMNILNLLDSYSNESSVNIHDVREQILSMIDEIEYYKPESEQNNQEFQRINQFCKTFTF